MTDYLPLNKTTDLTNPGVRRVVAVSAPSDDDLERRYTVSNVGKYLSAEASLRLEGPVTDATYENRKSQCMSCFRRKQSDKIPDEIGFCGGCGCGVSERARLTVKLRMPSYECPDRKFSRAKGRHPRLSDRVKAWIVRRLIGNP